MYMSNSDMIIKKLNAFQEEIEESTSLKRAFLETMAMVQYFDTEAQLIEVQRIICAEAELERKKLSELELVVLAEFEQNFKIFKKIVMGKLPASNIPLHFIGEYEKLRDIVEAQIGEGTHYVKSMFDSFARGLNTLLRNHPDIFENSRLLNLVVFESNGINTEAWNISPHYAEWLDEFDRLERIKSLRTGYNWDRIALIYNYFTQYEKNKNKFSHLPSSGLHFVTSEINAILNDQVSEEKLNAVPKLVDLKMHVRRVIEFTSHYLVQTAQDRDPIPLSSADIIFRLEYNEDTCEIKVNDQCIHQPHTDGSPAIFIRTLQIYSPVRISHTVLYEKIHGRSKNESESTNLHRYFSKMIGGLGFKDNLRRIFFELGKDDIVLHCEVDESRLRKFGFGPKQIEQMKDEIKKKSHTYQYQS